MLEAITSYNSDLLRPTESPIRSAVHMHPSCMLLISLHMCIWFQGQPIAYGNYKEIVQRCSEDERVAATLSEVLATLMDKETIPLINDFGNNTMEQMGYSAKTCQKRRKIISMDNTLDESNKFSNVITEDDKGTVSVRTHLSYLKAGGGCIFNCFMIALFLMTQVNLYTVTALLFSDGMNM